MKKSVIKIGLFSLVLIGLASCKNEEKELADKRIGELESFIDSLKTVSATDREANWDEISTDFNRKETNANYALASLDDETKTSFQAKIDASNTKFEEFKASREPAKPNPSQTLRDRLFGAGKIGADMSFAWVNKDNILNVYETFFQSYKDNKSDFSREDYDEIKLMYEALDNRKNTVEKEGLSASDNNKIASIKLKFSPMFKVNRMGAKSRETAEAKA